LSASQKPPVRENSQPPWQPVPVLSYLPRYFPYIPSQPSC